VLVFEARYRIITMTVPDLYIVCRFAREGCSIHFEHVPYVIYV